MILTLTRPLVSLDVETHDKCNPENAHVIELGIHIDYPDGKPPKEWNSLIRPPVAVSKGATEVHGITNEALSACRLCGHLHTDQQSVPYGDGKVCDKFHPWPRFKDIAENLAQGLTNVDFCGYNVDFDLKAIGGEMSRAGVKWSYETAYKLDPLRIWRNKEPKHLTDAVRRFLKREPTSAHRALGDALDAREVGLAQLEMWPDLPRSVVGLHELCFPKNLDAIDPDSKFVWIGNEPCIGFGKHKGTSLRKVPRNYLEWMAGSDFSTGTKNVIRDVLAGRFPTRS